MKWIKGILVLGMVIFAQSTISINELEAKTKTTQQKGKKDKKSTKSKQAGKKDKKDKSVKADKSGKKNGGFFASLKSGFSSLGSKIKAGASSLGAKIKSEASALKDKASNAMNCRAGKGEAPGKALYAMAMKGDKLTDAHVVAAHASPGKHTKGRK